MANYKKTPNFWGIGDMIDYVKQRYPNVKAYLESKNNSDDEKRNEKIKISSKIKRTCKAYEIGYIESNKQGDFIFVAEKIAKVLIDDILEDYLKGLFFDDVKKKFMQMDEQLTDISWITAPGSSTEEDMTKEVEEKYPDFSDENGIAKSYYEYHIRGIELSSDEIDTIVDRTMLRAIFDHLFEFNEYEFRKAFAEREGLVDLHPPVEYSEGYSELTYKLENPLGHYIFPRKETSAQNRKSTKKETSTQNQKSTKKESEK